MENAVTFRTIMNEPYRDHPNEDALERFLLHQSEEDELEIVETHILACEACVTRLEILEFQIEATKLALQGVQAEQAAKIAQSAPSRTAGFRPAWLDWLTTPRLSFAGVSLASCAMALTFACVPRDVNLTAFRGSEAAVVTQWLPLELHLNATDLPTGPVMVEVVDGQGGKIWQGPATVKDELINVKVSRLTAAGPYFIRVYSANNDVSVDLLREFSIQTKPLF